MFQVTQLLFFCPIFINIQDFYLSENKCVSRNDEKALHAIFCKQTPTAQMCSVVSSVHCPPEYSLFVMKTIR